MNGLNPDDERDYAIAAHCHSIAVGYMNALSIVESSRDMDEARARIQEMVAWLTSERAGQRSRTG